MNDLVSELLQEAYELKQSKDDLLERTQVNRASLRNLKSAGKLSSEQGEEVEEIYPTITRTRKAKPNGNV